MNVLFADDRGDIGQIMAVRAPVRPDAAPEDVVLNPADPACLWQGFKGPCDLPQGWNPPIGFLASCNNLPARSNPPVGWLFSPNDRVARTGALLGASGKVSLDQVKAVQADVYSATDFALRDLFLRRIAACGLAGTRTRTPTRRRFMAALAGWDGCYDTDSAGAVAFQTLLYHFAERVLLEALRPAHGADAPEVRLRARVPQERPGGRAFAELLRRAGPARRDSAPCSGRRSAGRRNPRSCSPTGA